MTDIHAHILSGFDDGADNPDVSLEMAKRSLEDNVTRIVATPHVMEGSFSGLPGKIEERVRHLREDLGRASIDVDILPGAEVHISATLLDRPESLRELTLGFGGKYLLLELPMQEMPRFTHELVFKLLLKGIVPILAHPERNLSITEQPQRLLGLVEKGSLVQVNAGSITGSYGQKVRDTAELFLRNRIVHFIGSDAHSVGSRSPGLSAALARARDLIGGEAEALVEENPSAALAGRTLEFPTPKRLVWKRKKLLSWLSGRTSS